MKGSHIVKYDFHEYEEKLRSYIGTTGGLCPKQYELLSNMILINARIWHIKFRFFTFALYLNISGIVMIAIGLFIKST